MMGPYTQVWLLHPHAATFAWLPWVLLALEKRSPLGTAVATAGLVMGGHPETAAHSMAIAGAWTLARGHWRTALLGLPLGVLLAAPVWMPLAEEILRSASLEAHGGNRVQAVQLLDLVWPGWHGHPALETWSGRAGIWSDGRLHPGLGVLALAILGLVRRPRRVRGLWLAWVLCLLAACVGLPGPANHARLGAMGAWFMALAGGISLAGLTPRWRPAAAGLVAATSLWASWPDQGTVPSEVHAPTPAAWTQSLRDTLGCAPDASRPEGCGRVLGLGWALQPNTGSLAGLRDIRGYDLPVSWETERLQRMLRQHPARPWFQVDTLPSLDLLRFLAVRAVASPTPLPGLEAVDLGPAPLTVHLLPGPAPRAWLATAPRHAPDPDQAARTLAADADRARPPVFGLEGRWPAQGQVHPVQVQRDDPGAVTLTVTTPSRGVLVLADAWHPGWRAYLEDGTQLEVLQVGGVLRGVELSAGAHTVHQVFEPSGWIWGCWLGLVGIILILVKLAFMLVYSDPNR